MHGVLLFVEQHARLPRLDAGHGERHVGEVAERQPALLADVSIPENPGSVVAGLFAQVQPVAITQQQALAGAVRALDFKRGEFCMFHGRHLVDPGCVAGRAETCSSSLQLHV